MTTYTLPGFVMQESADEETVVGLSYAQIQFVVPDATVGFSTRVIGRSFDDDEDLLALEIDDYITLLDDENVDSFSELDLSILNVSSPSGTGIVANAFDNATNRSYVFVLDGNPVPDSALENPAAINAFLETITVTPPATGSGFQPGNFIRFDSLPDIIMTEDDDIPGTPGDDSLFGGAGNDIIDGAGGDDFLSGDAGNDRLFGSVGNDTLDGGAGARDRAVYNEGFGAATFSFEGDTLYVDLTDSGDFTTYRDTLTGIELLEFSDRTVTVSSLRPAEEVTGDDGVDEITTGGGDDVVDGGGGDDTIDAGSGDDRVSGGSGDDVINGGDGADRINGGDGTDTIDGGTSVDDLSDTIFGGNGDDVLRGGYGNDFIYGQDGNDSIAGGFGSDELYGQNDDDVITGSALSDLVFGGAGDDFVNGGFGFDRINGGTGADKFFHVGVEGHGSDWIQDYTAAEGDVLLFGIASARASDFQVNFTHTASKTTGERSGDDDVEEAFVIYKPTGQIMWALVDGGGEAQINLQIGADVFDLLA